MRRRSGRRTKAMRLPFVIFILTFVVLAILTTV